MCSSEPAMRRIGVPKSGRSMNAEQQARDPENVLMGEQRQQAQHGDNLELDLLRLVGHALGQRVQVKNRRPVARI